MIVYRFQNNLIYAYLLLTTLLHIVAAVPFCTALYGAPDTASCDELLHGDGTSSGYIGIGNTDRGDHLFALPHTLRPPHTTDEQWNNQVKLPIIRANRKPITPSNQHLLPLLITIPPRPLQTGPPLYTLPQNGNLHRHKPLPRNCLHRRPNPKIVHSPHQAVRQRRTLSDRYQHPPPPSPLRAQLRL